jgi:hypothetical protein
MSTGFDDKNIRLKIIKGGKAEPRSPITSGKKPMTNLTKSRTFASRAGRSTKDKTILEDASKLIEELVKEIELKHGKLPKDR